MNEMYSFSTEEMLEIGQAIDSLDGTRPVVYEDGLDVGECRSVHYPRSEGVSWEGQPEWGKDKIYLWKTFVSDYRPTTSGEVIYAPGHDSYETMGFNGKRNVWWQGIWTRGMRMTGWDYFAPSCIFTWVWQIENDEDFRVVNLRNAMAPVAIFDIAYDELGVAPFIGDSTNLICDWPHLHAGDKITRKLIIFNDEFKDEEVMVSIKIRIGKTIFAAGSKEYLVPLGSNQEITCSAQIPFGKDGEELQIVLETYKGNRKTYEEIKRFVLDNPERQNGISSSEIFFYHISELY